MPAYESLLPKNLQPCLLQQKQEIIKELIPLSQKQAQNEVSDFDTTIYQQPFLKECPLFWSDATHKFSGDQWTYYKVMIDFRNGDDAANPQKLRPFDIFRFIQYFGIEELYSNNLKKVALIIPLRAREYDEYWDKVVVYGQMRYGRLHGKRIRRLWYHNGEELQYAESNFKWNSQHKVTLVGTETNLSEVIEKLRKEDVKLYEGMGKDIFFKFVKDSTSGKWIEDSYNSFYEKDKEQNFTSTEPQQHVFETRSFCMFTLKEENSKNMRQHAIGKNTKEPFTVLVGIKDAGFQEIDRTLFTMSTGEVIYRPERF